MRLLLEKVKTLGEKYIPPGHEENNMITLPCNAAGCSIECIQITSKRSPVESEYCFIAKYSSVELRSLEWTTISLDCLNVRSSDFILAHTFRWQPVPCETERHSKCICLLITFDSLWSGKSDSDLAT